MNFVDNLFTCQINPVVIDWVWRVQKNGGGTPSRNTVIAANNFYNGIVKNNLLSSIKACCLFCPDSLVSALTPLINLNNCSNDPWTNSSFLSTDLSILGLQGNGSTKYVDTGFTCDKFDSANSAGLTCYNTLGSNANNGDMGIWSSPTNIMGIYLGYTGTAYLDCWNSGGGRISAANSLGTGYFCYNRDSATTSQIYKANSTTPHATIASGTGQTGIGSLPTGYSIWMLGQNSNYRSSRRFSFGAIHSGFTANQSAAFYSLVQSLRQQIGGGYV